MKKKQLAALGVIIFALAASCSNPFFPEKKGGNTEFEGDISAEFPVISVGVTPEGPYILGDEVTITASAAVNDGGTLSYQWYGGDEESNTGGEPIPNETGATYTPPTDTAGTVYYYARVTNTLNGKTASAVSGTVKITVYDIGNATAIRNVSLTVTAPVKDGVPAAAATTDDIGYTCTAATWNPAHNPFQGGTVYTVTVTLAADENYIFAEALDAKINDTDALVTSNTGTAATLSLEFDPTLTKTVTDITVTAQPTKLAYTHGDLLDLSGLVVTLAFDDGTDEEIALADFGTNITTVPADGAALSRTDHDGESVVVYYGELTAETDQLTINCRIIFNTNGGGSIPNQGIAVGGVANRPANPTLSGYVFDFWYADAGLTIPYNFAATVTDNITLYAKWISQTDITAMADNGMVLVPGGSFDMGKNLGTASGSDATPVHTVTLTGFYMGKYEVTQKQWQDVMGSLPSSLPSSSYGVGDNYPVYYVSWYDALVFCNKLSMMEGLTPAYRINNSTDPAAWGTVPTSSDAAWNAAVIVSGSTGYRLPTEAQWEYAAKGGDPTAAGWVGYTYAGSNNPYEVAWYNYNGGSNSNVVGTKAPNGLGIYDMSGNVWEWCWDWYGTYQSGAQTDPVGASSGSDRVRRGGGWNISAENVRSAGRGNSSPSHLGNLIGFRLVRP